MITPPDSLKRKLKGPPPALDESAIARAERALANMSSQFEAWIADETAGLAEAWSRFDVAPRDQAAVMALHRRAHDLKGLAPTYGYPIVGRICASLCRITAREFAAQPPAGLVRAHVEAVKVAVGAKMSGDAHPVALAVATELETKVRELAASPPPQP